MARPLWGHPHCPGRGTHGGGVRRVVAVRLAPQGGQWRGSVSRAVGGYCRLQVMAHALTVEDVLEAAYGTAGVAVCLPSVRDVSAPSLAVLCTYFRSPSALCAYLRTRTAEGGEEDPVFGLPAIQSGAAARWRTYCAEVERTLRSGGRGEGGQGDEAALRSVFGTCRRCGSSRLLVTTRQLRRTVRGGGQRPPSRRRRHDRAATLP